MNVIAPSCAAIFVTPYWCQSSMVWCRHLGDHSLISTGDSICTASHFCFVFYTLKGLWLISLRAHVYCCHQLPHHKKENPLVSASCGSHSLHATNYLQGCISDSLQRRPHRIVAGEYVPFWMSNRQQPECP